MKKFIVDIGKKKYSVEANDAEHAVELVKKIDDDAKKAYSVVKIKNRLGNVSVYGGPMSAEKAEETAKYLRNRSEYRTCKIWVEKRGIKDSTYYAVVNDDEASQLQTVNALIDDEKAAVGAYDVAIENLRGKIPEESLQAIIAIRDDENRHIENLQAVVNGTVTAKNLEDSMINDAYTVADTELVVGKTFTTKSGHKLKVTKVVSGYSEYNGNPEISINYDYEKTDGTKGSSVATTKDFFNMMQDSATNDSINDGIRLDEIESQLIRAQEEARKRDWGSVKNRCTDVIAAIETNKG